MGHKLSSSLFMVWNDAANKVRVGCLQRLHQTGKLFLSCIKLHMIYICEYTIAFGDKKHHTLLTAFPVKC